MGRRTDFSCQFVPVGTGLHLEEAKIFLVGTLRILPIKLERRPGDVNQHIVRQHQRAFIIADDALDRVFHIVKYEMLSNGIPAVTDLAGKRFRNKGICDITQYFRIT